MGILDSVIGSLLGGGHANPGSSGMGGVLSSLLGGGQSGAGDGMAGAGGMGGLGGIVSKFEQAGLGNVAQSWIGNGANHLVSPQQLQDVFGDQVPQMANQAGMNQGDFLYDATWAQCRLAASATVIWPEAARKLSAAERRIAAIGLLPATDPNTSFMNLV